MGVRIGAVENITTITLPIQTHFVLTSSIYGWSNNQDIDFADSLESSIVELNFVYCVFVCLVMGLSRFISGSC